jgi:hypothetical protein
MDRADFLRWGAAGAVAAGGLPNPLAVEQAGTKLDRLITTPAFTS